MHLSDKTVSVLKNFSTINQNLLIKEGKTLSTMSAMKNIVANATVEETFPKEVAIYDLNEFLGCLSLFKSPILSFKDTSVVITEENGSSGDSLEYMYSDPSVVTTPSKDITMPSEEITFTLTDAMLSKLSKSAGMIGAPDLLLENNKLTVRDKKNDSGNCYSTSVQAQGDGTYKFYFKTENLKLIPGSYDVTVSSKNISHFKNGKTQYWIALEPESSYSA